MAPTTEATLVRYVKSLPPSVQLPLGLFCCSLAALLVAPLPFVLMGKLPPVINGLGNPSPFLVALLFLMGFNALGHRVGRVRTTGLVIACVYGVLFTTLALKTWPLDDFWTIVPALLAGPAIVLLNAYLFDRYRSVIMTLRTAQR